MKNLKMPIGQSDFKHLIEEGYYYIDKSLFIQEVLERSSLIMLLPRPRRFGKTLNLSMLRYFLEHTEENRAHLFQGLSIVQVPEIMRHQGQYPLIFVTFKDVKAPDFATCIEHIHTVLSKEYERHINLSMDWQTPREQRQWQNILEGTASQTTLMQSLALLMRGLHRVHEKRVVVLIDEYDAPIHAGHQYGYYDDIIVFMRNLLSAAFKDNADLEKGVLTGILRVAKESIFSGLNNLDVYSLLDLRFAEYFGFTPAEVEHLLEEVNLMDCLPQIEAWYNGYIFGEQQMYNPWSLLNFIDKYPGVPQPYWINTSGNELVRELITQGNPDVQESLEALLAGDTVRSVLNDNIVLRDIRAGSETVLNLLTYSGYLKPAVRVEDPFRQVYELAIPNQEVRLFYEDSIRTWLHRQTGDRRLRQLLTTLTQGDLVTFGKVLQDIVVTILSYHDTAGDEPERVYHAFALGLFVHLSDQYTIRSNRESGYGRYDLLMIPKDAARPGFVFEFKKIDKDDEKTPQAAMQSAFRQIRDKEYATELKDANVTRILGVGVVVEGKQVWVESIDL